eukprot:TRINITY_DN19465_c0_g1_i3.p1 TRINITY_DN19465_c0_g1~~TRINITY_DN19465_c0_g1_i3.p1  ORF type:complete len:300 (+),score=72.29 TRINITY_DN19465_c0_g1_i3:95-901(+)
MMHRLRLHIPHTALRRYCTVGSHIFIWDIESTGVSSRWDQVIEIAALHPVSGKVFDKLVKPTKARMKDGAVEVHGIQMERLEGEKVFEEVWGEYMEWVKECYQGDGKVLLLSHFAHSLDIPMVKYELERTQHVSPHPENWILADAATAIRSKAKHDAIPPASYSLKNLCSHLSIEVPPHRALDDTRALWSVLRHYYPDEAGLKALTKLYTAKKRTEAKKTGFNRGVWWTKKKAAEPQTQNFVLATTPEKQQQQQQLVLAKKRVDKEFR